ncbi:hypothetical protein ACDH63_07455 [Xanthomonas axonopodis pv. maculifoliigardeniae]|uniref:hypothetical protein n=1 Tax=Xanthomonas axonopodis TaxID=53413 RepID=UPI0035569DB5
MNKYEEIFEKIVDKTNSGEISWRQVKKDSNSNLIFNADYSFRQYEGKFENKGQEFQILLVEKKMPDPEHDMAYERYMPEILIIDENKDLIVTMTESVIERGKIGDLAQEIEQKNGILNKLFEAE